MSLINKEVSEFKVYAFHENDFQFVTKEDILGKWSVFFFYPADFTFVCPTELEDLAEKYEQFKARRGRVQKVRNRAATLKCDAYTLFYLLFF